jgi:hypothetical protein
MGATKEFLERHQFVIIFSTLAAVLLATIVEVMAVLGAGIADWYMHLAMWTLLLTYFVLTTWMVATRRRIRSWINVLVLEFLAVFWIVIMHSRIPAEKVVVDGQLTLREPLYILWVPILLLGLAALVLPLVALTGRRRRPEKEHG